MFFRRFRAHDAWAARQRVQTLCQLASQAQSRELPHARGIGAGSQLIHRWLDRLRTAGVPGCHLQTMAENTSAIAFFTACGFERAGGTPQIPGMRSKTGGRLHIQAMVQSL